MPFLSLLRPVVGIWLFLQVLRPLSAEWGFDAALGGSPVGYYDENLRKYNSSYQNEISGLRRSIATSAKFYWNWLGARFAFDYALPGSGIQTTRSNVQSAPNQNFQQQTTTADSVEFATGLTYRAELQLRQFSYGHRETFTFSSGFLFRRVVTELTGQPADYAAQALTNRYLTLGITYEPLITYFGRYELSLPVDFSLGLKFPQGGIIDGGGPGAVLLGMGLRLQQEPRGFYLQTQGLVQFFDTSYSIGSANYSFGQTDVGLRVMAGFYFRDTIYNE